MVNRFLAEQQFVNEKGFLLTWISLYGGDVYWSDVLKKARGEITVLPFHGVEFS